jgi:hypothetical protein
VRFERIPAVRGEQHERSARPKHAIHLPEDAPFVRDVFEHLVQQRDIHHAVFDRDGGEIAHGEPPGQIAARRRDLLFREFDAPCLGAEAPERLHVLAGAAAAIEDLFSVDRHVLLDRAETLRQVQRGRGISTRGLDVGVRRIHARHARRCRHCHRGTP